MLEIKDLHASINGKEILKGINLTVKPGEVHAIMVPVRVLCRRYWWGIRLLR
jgi:Fe-S cluster assembly ATPase SufC